jgi:peptidoglycan/LPS O-acetylase OafA/YrhL
MLRFAEIGLFLAPFALFLVWRLLASRVRPALLWIGTVVLVALAGMAVGFGLHERMDPHARYVPAHMVDGRIVPGHGVER